VGDGQALSGAVDPQKLIHELKAQAPRYAKLLPELPGLLHQYLQRQGGGNEELMRELLQEQKRTNRLLQTLVAVVIGFSVGLVLVQLWARIRLF
jgi:ubiquinone biosynthesis protein